MNSLSPRFLLHIRAAHNLIVIGGVLSACLSGFAQNNEWVWMSGPPYGAIGGKYGTMGIASSSNLPGPHENGVSWTDNQGRLWTLGGFGEDSQSQLGSLNDLWMFDPAINEWTWEAGGNRIQRNGVYGTEGSGAAGNTPGARQAAMSWTDSQGNLWLFGGVGLDSAGTIGTLNDLWVFTPSTNQWTWIAGNNTLPKCSSSSECGWPGIYGTKGTASRDNLPGSRAGSVTWTDRSGNVWLFGGGGFDASGATGSLNDLWEFDPSTLTWTWVNGSNAIPACNSSNGCGVSGAYGKQGTPSASNQPGARGGAYGAIDSIGNLWLFGGRGFDGSGALGLLNDLWEYNASSGQWIWRGGANSVGNCGTPPLCGHGGNYGTYQTPGVATIPGGRSGGLSWTDKNGNFWLMGGIGLDQSSTYGAMNDLWVYNPSLQMWAWMAGSGAVEQNGVYGILGESSPDNTPGSRAAAVSWTDAEGNLWLFGGEGNNASGGPNTLNDLWRFQPAADEMPVVASPTFSPPGGSYAAIQTVAISDTTPNATIYYSTDGSIPNPTTSAQYGGPVVVSATETVQAIATAPGYFHSAVASAKYILTLPVAAPPIFSLPSATYSTAQTLSISDITPGATIYYTSDGSSPTPASIPYSSAITISVSETVQAIAVASGYANSAITSGTYTIWPPIPVADAWTWMSGSDQTSAPGVYGTLGTLAAGNVPGSRQNAVTWTDGKGNLWLFGGNGCTTTCVWSRLNDLWEFVPTANEWEWMGGTQQYSQAGVYGTLGAPGASNIPGARDGAVGWTDSNGKLWLFGGLGYDGSDSWSALNDLWRYDPSANEWTWVEGSSKVPSPCYPTYGGSSGFCGIAGAYGTQGQAAAANMPGSRSSAVSWTDKNGNLWLFGGDGFDGMGNPGLLNDLWKYDVTTNQWAWMNGSKALPISCAFGVSPGGCGIAGVYGTRGIANVSNVPGGRLGAVSWADKNGNLWLFGGYGFDANAQAAWLNDLWEYDVAKGQWTWISGSDSDGATGGMPPGVYGTWQTPAAGNTPGGRQNANAFTDAAGNLWLFGGNGFDASENIGYLNDLWMFNPTTAEWAWMGGSDTTNSVHGFMNGQVGTYGSLQTPSFTNSPGGRSTALAWTDPRGNFWLMGGTGFGTIAAEGLLNDLWEYQPDSVVMIAAAPTFSPPAGNIPAGQKVTLSDSTPGAIIYYQMNGMTAPVEYTRPIVLFGSSTIVATAVAPGYANGPATEAAYIVTATATPAFSLAPAEYATAQSVSITDTTPNALIYYTLDGTVPSAASTLYSGPLTVTTSETIEAFAIAPGDQASPVVVGMYTIWPSSAMNRWAWMTGGSAIDKTTGVWGTAGIPAFENTPSARSRPATWMDKSGNLWLFGGYGYDANDATSYLDDLWEFTPASNEWTWIGGPKAAPRCDIPPCGQPGIYSQMGKAAVSNSPGARSGPSFWTDASGTFWLFGGAGFDAAGTVTELNDLWSFQPQTREWTWVSGSNTASNCLSVPLEFSVCGGSSAVYGTRGTPSTGNNPGAREGANTWLDAAGNVWMLGGMSIDTDPASSSAAYYYLNDLWKFTPSTNQWTWISGGGSISTASCYGSADSWLATCGQPGVFGTFGIGAGTNTPGSRRGATTWIDSAGNLWLFGGYGFDGVGGAGLMDDLWEFSPSSGQWTWRGGSGTGSCDDTLFYDVCPSAAPAGSYGTQGVPSVGNVPPFISEAPGWTDKDGNFWLLGGDGSDTVWEFTPSANEWTWVAGSNAASLFYGLSPVYGIRGVPDPGNSPGARNSAAAWTDGNGKFWLFGGNGFFALSPGAHNDVWKFQPAAPAPIPSLELTPSAASISVVAGSNGSANIIATTGGGFNSPISLSASGLPAGMTVNFSPASIASAGSSTMTISTASSVAKGSYTITISGSGGGLNQTTTVAVVVSLPPPSFDLAESISSLTVAHGGTGTVTLTVTPSNGFGGTVSFACSGLPSGAMCTFNPTAVTPASAAVTTAVTISVPISSAAARKGSRGVFPLVALGIAFLITWPRRRARQSLVVLLILPLAAFVGSCGGSSSGGGSGPTSQSYSVTITASAGTIQKTTTLSLTVN